MEGYDNYVLDKDIGAVLYGLDTDVTFGKLAIASLYINERKVSDIE